MLEFTPSLMTTVQLTLANKVNAGFTSGVE